MKKDKQQKVGAVIVAAGSSERMGGVDKVLAPLGGKPILARVIDTFQGCNLIDQIVVVLSRQNVERCQQLVIEQGWLKVTDVCVGGRRRQDSVVAGLSHLSNCQWVVIHDGARPLITADLIERGLEAAAETGAAIAAVPVTDTIKLAGDDRLVKETPLRHNLWAVQTPQVFRFDIITRAYQQVRGDVTDDASLVEQMGGVVKLYTGSYDNIKVTTPDNLLLAEVLWQNMGSKMRAGTGYDVHPLVPGRRLVLGGIDVPFDKGLDGWSDSDVLTHAIIDALLGAAALGDIGSHFPPGEPQYKDISSLTLLKSTGRKLAENGWRVNNIDATIVAEQPRLRDFIDGMRQQISQTLGIALTQVSVKASTSSQLGFVGRGEGMATIAVVLLESETGEGRLEKQK